MNKKTQPYLVCKSCGHERDVDKIINDKNNRINSLTDVIKNLKRFYCGNCNKKNLTISGLPNIDNSPSRSSKANSKNKTPISDQNRKTTINKRQVIDKREPTPSGLSRREAILRDKHLPKKTRVVNEGIAGNREDNKRMYMKGGDS